MASLATIQIIGNLGRDPEMRYTASGRPVTQMTVAVNHGKKNPTSGEWENFTDWFRVTAWGQLGERVAERFRKGNSVAVTGRFETREWQGQDGAMRTSLEITADNVIGLDRRAEGDDAGYSNGNASSPLPAGSTADGGNADDLPF